MKKKEGSPGFTLLELLIASTLMIIFITGIVQSIALSLDVNRRCRARNITTETAVSALESLKSRPFGHPSLREGSWSDRLSSPVVPADIRLDYHIVDLSSGLKRVEIKCWIPAWRSFPVHSAVILSKELGF